MIRCSEWPSAQPHQSLPWLEAKCKANIAQYNQCDNGLVDTPMLWSCYVCGLVIHTINLSSPTVNALVTEQKSASSKLKTLKTQDCVQTIVDSNTSSSGGVAHSSIVELEGREIDAAARPANQGQRWPCTCFSVKLSEERLYRNNKRQRTVFFLQHPSSSS